MDNFREWSVREAKSKFSELIAEAEKEPQTIMNRGRRQAVVINIGEFEKMTKDLLELRRLFKRQNVLNLQKEIRAAFQSAEIDSIENEKTPTRPLPDFD